MSVVAEPGLTVAGLPVALGGSGELVAVDELRLTWGRSSLLEQPTPTRAQLTVRDRSPGRSFASRRDLVGQVAHLGWSIPGTASGAQTFVGRLTDGRARRDRHGVPLVSLAASSLEVDAVNYTVPEGTVWPAETFSARLARIMALFPSWLYGGGATLPPGWSTYTAAQADVGGADGLALLRTLYSSCARPMIFDPATGGFGYGGRRYAPAGGGAGQHVAALQQQPGGSWAASCSPVGGSWLDAKQFEYDGELLTDLSSRLTRVLVNYRDAGAEASLEADVSALLREDVIGRRVLQVDTAHGTPGGAQAALSEWASLAYSEAAVPRLEDVTFSTARTPFTDAAQVAALLSCTEAGAWRFLRRSWLPLFGVPPTVGVIGGAVTYARGEWTVQLHLAAAVNANQTPPLVSRYAAVDSTVRLRDLDPSVTCADLAHVTVGAGYTPDTQPLP